LRTSLNREHYNFFHLFRVRYSEIDAQGIVFNAHYFTYFDTAITELIREINFDYKALIASEGLDFYLVKSTIEYFEPAAFDQLIEVGVSIARIGRSSLTWELAIFRKDEEECLARGELVWVCTKLGSGKSHPLPDNLLSLINNSGLAPC